ncbi:Signal recognition particle receptor FtsY [Halomicronema hongdechloris C2206]|uniref:Signal recognition particle receptor FtsY n=1 Tax=Halomicronema hongdechloris C2206 TaxID=1641165 RepID=A0A1Z3HG13_9CYAN|nr:signal recognition particle-docking protein FtsY [Halomicronema hongdechloris]ASC69222.1 Signal recognition particle receptor FtsY [Halomicronema hongdechloris C2206]
MLGFNWFSRRYDNDSKSADAADEAAEQAAQSDDASEQSAQSDDTSQSAPESSNDYLAWAKAAYQSLRQQRAGQPATAEDSQAAPEPPPTADTAAPAATPFWAKADTERQQRLERLQQEAAVESAPKPAAAPAAAPESPLALDEAFLWSAEVLAAQGRRPDQVSEEEITWLNRLRQGLDKTRRGLVNQLKSVVGQGPLNQDAVLEIESLLLQADVGIEATDRVIDALQERLRQETLPPDQAINYLKSILRDMLDSPLAGAPNLGFVPERERLNIWLITGVNGAGKTTTIGKLAHIARKSGYSCLIAAADTFRAAAVEQVKAWGARSQVEVIANPGKNTDPAAVVFDAIASAQSRGTELLLVDTAGRLQNKKNLMEELAKVRRIIDRKAPDAQVESLLVLDATLGQNGLRQAQVFSEVANLSGVVLTKLDGTAKGGVALAVVNQLGLPIRFIGAGEGIEDLRPFSSYEFVEALLSG